MSVCAFPFPRCTLRRRRGEVAVVCFDSVLPREIFTQFAEQKVCSFPFWMLHDT